MKTIRGLFLAGVLSLFSVTISKAQEIVVRARMRPPTESLRPRPAAPSAQHVWIAEEWAPRGTSYTWKGGYWALPPHPGQVWIQGHWNHHRRGYVWVAGHWR
ncbi:MAG: YXWGXW repeat-containing protein [Mucilaginibacter sp.]